MSSKINLGFWVFYSLFGVMSFLIVFSKKNIVFSKLIVFKLAGCCPVSLLSHN